MYGGKKLLQQIWSYLGSLWAFHHCIVCVSPGHSPEPPHTAVTPSHLEAGELGLG